MSNQTRKGTVTGTGKLPVFDADLEEGVLGAMLLERSATGRALGLLKSGDVFYFERHKYIFQACQELYSEGVPVDLLTVTAKLRKMGKLQEAGGAAMVTEMTSRVSSSANIEAHCRILHEHWIKRELVKISSETMVDGMSYEIDAFEALEKVQKALVKVIESVDNGRTESLSASMVKLLKEVADRSADPGHVVGVATPFRALNEMLGGWRKSDLVILAARPSMGKTALMLNLARTAAASNIGVAVFSLEMSTEQLTARLMVQETKRYTVDDLDRGRVDTEGMNDLQRGLSKAYRYNFWIDDTPGLSLVQLRTKAWDLVTNHGVGLILVDYLQLMESGKDGGKGGNREQEVSNISRGLKALAKDLDIPVIALSQLSRAVESRGGEKKPQLSDLRESGAIEQDADVIFFLYRPEYYGIKQTADGMSTLGAAELIVAKNRKGKTGTVAIDFDKDYTDFTEPGMVARKLPPPPEMPKREDRWENRHNGISDFEASSGDDDDSPF